MLALTTPAVWRWRTWCRNNRRALDGMGRNLHISAALETANIFGLRVSELTCAGHLPEAGGESQSLFPSPPKFARDFAESLMQFALMNQAIESDIGS